MQAGCGFVEDVERVWTALGLWIFGSGGLAGCGLEMGCQFHTLGFAAFRRLIEAGGSIVVIEHNLEVIKTADWVIDLGPEGGNRGGTVVAAGTPETVAQSPTSYTGKFLARVLNGNGTRRNGRAS